MRLSRASDRLRRVREHDARHCTLCKLSFGSLALCFARVCRRLGSLRITIIVHLCTRSGLCVHSGRDSQRNTGLVHTG